MQRYKRLIAVVLFLGLLLLSFQLSGLREHLSLQFLHQQFLDHALTGTLVFTLAFVLGNLIQIPGWVFLGAAVLALGQLWGGLATLLAASVSCAATFWLIRLLGGDALRQLPGQWVKRLLRQLDSHPVRSVVVLRTLLQTAPALNYALAMSGLSFRHYMLGTLLGLPLPVALYCLFFDQVAHWLHLPVY